MIIEDAKDSTALGYAQMLNQREVTHVLEKGK